jgi:hypothetical protein
MAIYINGIGLISPQETRNNQIFLKEKIALDGEYFKINEPPYKDFIAPKELRRMSKILRNGIVAARLAMDESNCSHPDAILTGTGLGCAVDTEKFLISMVENQETLLTPTSFIQSTHNTLGGSIAIGLGCHNYNMTYVHRGFSFESALLDAQLMMDSGEIQNALVGGFDEMTDNHTHILRSSEQYHPLTGAVPGQGAGFFVLENQKKANSYAELLSIETLYKVPSEDVFQKIDAILKENGVDASKLLVLLGENGIQAEQAVYDGFKNAHSEINTAAYKDLCGEYYTSTAFAMWMGAQMLAKQEIPAVVQAKNHQMDVLEHVLIYNIFDQKETSLILMKNVEIQ